jgi:hypothetical protein
MVRPIKYAPICLFFDEVGERAGHEVLMEVDDNILRFIGDPRGILGKQLRPRPIHSLIIASNNSD